MTMNLEALGLQFSGQMTALASALALTVRDFGAVGDGVADDADAFDAALAALDTVAVPAGTYRLSRAVAIGSGKRLAASGGRPTVLSAGPAFTFSSVSDAGVEGIRIDAGSTAGVVVSLAGATRCIVRDVEVTGANADPTGAIAVTGVSSANVIAGCYVHDCVGSGIFLGDAGVTGNEVSANRIQNCTGFGVILKYGANRNLVSANSTTANGIELVGITSDCYLNRIIGNHAEGTGDNGISVSGYRNTVVGNQCCNNQKAGIHVWGAFNTIIGNECTANNRIDGQWAGIGVSANYAGTGQHNVIVGNLLDDDQAVPTQFNGVRLGGSSYVAWAAGQAVTSGTYRVAGLHVYVATSTGTTGATQPVHTSGTVSDGAVNWRYCRSFLTTADAAYNIVSGNRVVRFKSGAYMDAGNWLLNKLDKLMQGPRTGWAAATGSGSRGTFDSGTVTLPDLAKRVKTLIDDLTTQGVIGP